MLALHPCRIDLVCLPTPAFGRQWHLNHIGQAKVDTIPEELLYSGPSGRALLDPDHVPLATRNEARAIYDLVETLLRRQNLGEDLVLLGAVIIPADNAGTIVIVDGQSDILGHGGLRCKKPSRPRGQNLESHRSLLQSKLLPPRGQPPLPLPSPSKCQTRLP